MQSRKIPRRKVDRRDISPNRETWWQGHFPELTWTFPRTAVYVALPVLVSLLLGLLIVTPLKSSVVPYSADTVVMEQLSPHSFSLMGYLCGDHSFSSYHHCIVSDVLVTEGRWVVLAVPHRQSIVVQSWYGVQTVELGCSPYGLTRLPSGRVAVTCPESSAVLLVSLGFDHHQIQRILTYKKYRHVAAHPVDNALIVGTSAEIDVITLKGDVIRNLMRSTRFTPKYITSLTVANGYLLVTDDKSERLHRMDLSHPSESPLEPLAGIFTFSPHDTAVDAAGNVFIVLGNGIVFIGSEGRSSRQLTGRYGTRYERCRVSVYDDKLLLVTATKYGMSEVTEYQLLDL